MTELSTRPVSRLDLRCLHPGWFASVMGTAITAVATFGNPGGIAELRGASVVLGLALAALALGLGVVFTVLYTLRWVRYGRVVLDELRDPAIGGLHATFPAGLLVLGVLAAAVGPSVAPWGRVLAVVAVLALVGGVLAVTIGVMFAYALFTREVPAPSVNGSWFIPPVSAIIVSSAVAPLVPVVDPTTARTLLVLGYACWGIGLMLFLLVLGALHDRLVLQPLPPAQVAPSQWIALGPVGVAILGSGALARAGQPIFGASGAGVVLATQLLGTALWGFGLWWLAVAASLLFRYRRAGAVPFHLGWWGFTFPLGAFTVATLTLAKAWEVPLLTGIGVVLYLLLLVFWLTVATRTLRMLRGRGA